VNARTTREKDNEWAAFKAAYANETFQEVVEYIESEWLNQVTARKFLHCYTNEYLHFGELFTSRNEGSHRMIKRDLEVSTHDLLGVVQSLHRTISVCYTQVDDQLLDDRVRQPRSLLAFLYRDVINKISKYALFHVQKLHDTYLPIGAPNQKEIKPCTGSNSKTRGLPCIHTIRPHINLRLSLNMTNFHPQWYIVERVDQPIVLSSIVLDPAIAKPRGRPSDRSTRRDLSRFEHIERQVEGHGRGSGRGRGGNSQISQQPSPQLEQAEVIEVSDN
jgi:hypothetical protein